MTLFMRSFFMLSLFAAVSIAQVLKVTTNVEFAHLPIEEQNDLLTLGDKISQYYNGYDWTEDEYEYDVECTIQIIIESVKSRRAEKIYKAQFVITSNSGENFYDKMWEFPYTKSMGLSYSKVSFNPLTNFLEFYAYMVLGGEMDSNGPLLGTPFYSKAMDIANEALVSQYQQGWTQRLEQLQRITDTRNKPLRELKPSFFEAMYLLDEGNVKDALAEGELVMQGIRKVVKMLPNSKPLKTFFNAHYKELATLFRGHTNYLDELIRFDSKHREMYREMRE